MTNMRPRQAGRNPRLKPRSLPRTVRTAFLFCSSLQPRKSLEPTAQPLFFPTLSPKLLSVRRGTRLSGQNLPHNPRILILVLYYITRITKSYNGRQSKIGVASGEVPHEVPREVTISRGARLIPACRGIAGSDPGDGTT